MDDVEDEYIDADWLAQRRQRLNRRRSSGISSASDIDISSRQLVSARSDVSLEREACTSYRSISQQSSSTCPTARSSGSTSLQSDSVDGFTTRDIESIGTTSFSDLEQLSSRHSSGASTPVPDDTSNSFRTRDGRKDSEEAPIGSEGEGLTPLEVPRADISQRVGGVKVYPAEIGDGDEGNSIAHSAKPGFNGKSRFISAARITKQTLMMNKKNQGGTVSIATGAWIYGLQDDERTRLLMLMVLTIYILAGCYLYHCLEGWGMVDSLYFVITTVTTVGYGDLSPSTPLSRFVTCLFATFGLGLIAGMVGLLGSYYADKFLQDMSQANKLIQAKKAQIRRGKDPGREGKGPAEDGHGALGVGSKGRATPISEMGKIYVAAVGMISAILLGTIAYANIEGEGLSYSESFYLSVMTTTTVGFGDVSPKTLWGRGLALVWIPVGCVITGYALGLYLDIYVEIRQKKMQDDVLHRELTHADMSEADDDGDGNITQAEYILFKLEKMALCNPGDINRIALKFNRLKEKHALCQREDQHKGAAGLITHRNI